MSNFNISDENLFLREQTYILNQKNIIIASGGEQIHTAEDSVLYLNGQAIVNTFLADFLSQPIEKYLISVNESGQPSIFEYIINPDTPSYLQIIIDKYSGPIPDGAFIVSVNNISRHKKNEKLLIDELSKLRTRVTEVERDIDFYVKQGDIITKQRSKVQSERDQLATDKTEMLHQRKMLEEEMDFIIKQGDKIAEQKHKIRKQKDLVESQKKKITDSIQYAKRIQSAVLPPNKFVQHLLAEHFILYIPKDIVSGDYYWIKQFDNKIYIAAADCTGHGVPGALMSMLGITFLNEIVNKNPDTAANEILNELRIHIISSLRQTGKVGESRDGMDMALCILNNKEKTLEYAGANNPLYLIRENELITYKSDRMPIGIHRKAKVPFQNNIIDVKTGDSIYIFSDGYIDQFGGEEGRKFLSTTFKQLLLDNHHLTMADQKKALEDNFTEWKGEYKQLDDILIIGFKLDFDQLDQQKDIQHDWSKYTILIAEDDKSNLMLLERALDKTNVKILAAPNGREALNIVKSEENISVILMDIRMPEMDGIEATHMIKDIKPNIPIIVQTAFTMSSEKEKAFKSGCDDYISKPLNIKELYATISKYIERED